MHVDMRQDHYFSRRVSEVRPCYVTRRGMYYEQRIYIVERKLHMFEKQILVGPPK